MKTFVSTIIEILKRYLCLMCPVPDMMIVQFEDLLATSVKCTFVSSLVPSFRCSMASKTNQNRHVFKKRLIFSVIILICQMV